MSFNNQVTKFAFNLSYFKAFFLFIILGRIFYEESLSTERIDGLWLVAIV